MKTTRRNTFETNSSSTHSMTLIPRRAPLKFDELIFYPLYISPTGKQYSNCLLLNLNHDGISLGEDDCGFYSPVSIACVIAVCSLMSRIEQEKKDKILENISEIFKSKFPKIDHVIVDPTLNLDGVNSESITLNAFNGCWARDIAELARPYFPTPPQSMFDAIENKEFLEAVIFKSILISNISYI